MEILHAGTTAAFLVNGELSDPIKVRTGIRQGCPVAPLLFLIAAEALRHAVSQTPGLTGIRLKGIVADHDHIFSAYVDDSVTNLRCATMIPLLHRTLERFAAVSGLRVQPQESHVLLLTNTPTVSRIGPFPVVPPGTTTEYLRVRVGWTDMQDANWDHRIDTILKRLGLLSQYTTSVLDRVQVINLAATASLLFTAKFFRPSVSHCKHIDEMWRQFIGKGTVTSSPQRSHKIAHEIMVLPKHQGGLGLADYRSAIRAQAVKILIRWNTKKHDKYWEAMHALLADQLGTTANIIHIFPAATDSAPRPSIH